MKINKQLKKGNTMKKVIMMIGLISVIGLNLNTAANALVLVDGYFKSNSSGLKPFFIIKNPLSFNINKLLISGGPCWLRSNYPCNVNAVLYY